MDHKKSFHLYTLQLWKRFSDIFANADVVNAQNERHSLLKIQSSHLKKRNDD